jgi:hypothetical protein
MHTWLLIAFAAVVLLFTVMLVYSLALAWRGAMADDDALPLDEMMARRGISRAVTPALMLERELAAAGRRCVLCAVKAQCRDWLASAPRLERASFCPNQQLLDQMALRRAA